MPPASSAWSAVGGRARIMPAKSGNIAPSTNGGASERQRATTAWPKKFTRGSLARPGNRTTPADDLDTALAPKARSAVAIASWDVAAGGSRSGFWGLRGRPLRKPAHLRARQAFLRRRRPAQPLPVRRRRQRRRPQRHRARLRRRPAPLRRRVPRHHRCPAPRRIHRTRILIRRIRIRRRTTRGRPPKAPIRRGISARARCPTWEASLLRPAITSNRECGADRSSRARSCSAPPTACKC